MRRHRLILAGLLTLVIVSAARSYSELARVPCQSCRRYRCERTGARARYVYSSPGVLRLPFGRDAPAMVLGAPGCVLAHRARCQRGTRPTQLLALDAVQQIRARRPPRTAAAD